MEESALAELEGAARLFMEAPQHITLQQRQAAEAVIINFRKSKSAYGLCQQILDKSAVDLLRFEAADVIKNSLISEWTQLQEQDRLALRQYLFNYIVTKTMPAYVREKILQVIAIMIKRSGIEDGGVERGFILQEIEKMFRTNDMQQQMLGCRILLAIMQEYAITVKSDDKGLTFEEHFRAKKQFEIVNLKKVFVMVLTCLEERMKTIDLTDGTNVHALVEIVQILEQCLCWGFVSPLLPKRFLNMFEGINKGEQNPPLRLNAQWAPIILDPKVLQVIFSVYWTVRELPELQRKTLNCIVQLSTLNGAVVNNATTRKKYFTDFLTHLLQLLSNIQEKESESIGVSTIFKKLLTNYSPQDIKQVPAEIQTAFLQQMFNHTNKMIEMVAHEGNQPVQPEELIYTEALEKVLDAWIYIIHGKDHLPTELVEMSATEMFNKYLQCRLSVPDGMRTMEANADSTDHEQPDRERYRDQLVIVGLFGRERPGHSLPLLAKLLEERGRHLHAHLQQVFDANISLNPADTLIRENLFEDINWLLMISAHVLAYDADNEHQEIPSQITRFCVQQMTYGLTNTRVSLDVLAAPGTCMTKFPHAENCMDPVIRLVAAIFRICEIERSAIEAKMHQFWSPSVGSTIIWCLKLWANPYLLIPTEMLERVSEPLSLAFGVDTEGGQWATNFVLSKILSNIEHFSHEEEVLNETINLFVSIVKKNHKCQVVLSSPYFETIFELRKRDIPSANLIKGLMISICCIKSNELQNQYLFGLMKPISDKFCCLEWQAAMNGNNDMGKSLVVNKLVYILEEIKSCIIGCSTAACMVEVYKFFEPVFINLADIVDLFHNYQTIVVETLQMLCELVQRLLFLERHKVYEICTSVIRIYVKHNVNRVTSEATGEEENISDLMLVLTLMYNLLSRNFFDVNEEADSTMDAAEVCVVSLQAIMPLITLDLLTYPDLCTKYFQTITFFIETKFHKVCTLPPDLLTNMLQSVEYGLRSFGIDVQSICLDFLQNMGKTVFFDQNPSSFMYSALLPFLKMLLEMILTHDIDVDNKTDWSKALFSLICCYKTQYVQIVEQIIQANPANSEALSKAFSDLTNNMEITHSRMMQQMFIDKFDKFLIIIRPLYN